MYGYREKHDCQLEVVSLSMLPRLHPNASRFRKLLRRLRVLALVSRSNPKTMFVFKSESSICMERKRQIKYFSKFVIHPYSFISMVKEITMAVMWFIFFTLDSFKIGFLEKETIAFDALQMIFDLLHSVHVVLCFMTGYHDTNNREIILKPKLLIRRYLITYFLFDLSALIPTDQFLESKDMYWIGLIIHILVCPRFITMGQYFRQITMLLNVGDVVHELTLLIIGGFFLTHWFAVLMYAFPNFRYKFYEDRYPASWTLHAKITRDYTNVSLTTRYIQSLHKASALFFGCSRGMWISSLPFEWLIFSVIILCGVLYISYITAVILQLSMTYKMSESMYDEMIYQLFQYTKAKKLPTRLRIRLQLYYEARFREKYFREHTILSTLSEHLRYEIMYCNCSQFIQTAWFFEDVPKAIVGHVIASLNSTILITNEVIFSEDDIDEPKLYFVSSGSAALYTVDGEELTHIEDGDYFGEHAILSKIAGFKVSNVTRSMRVVAAEITELFFLTMSDFAKYFAIYPQAMERIMQVAEIRDNLNIKILAKRRRVTEFDIFGLLRTSNIFEGRLRKAERERRYGGTDLN
ncbi:hypothetical protein Trydic_g15195 [Trypoxylus dichotomus]